MNAPRTAPQLARRLLSRALPADVREHIVDDMDEVFRQRAQLHGRTRARLWYWGEALSFGSRFLRERLRDGDAATGGVGRTRAHGPVRGLSWLDVKLGMRILVKYPGLTFVAVVGMSVAVSLAAAWWEFSRNMSDPNLPIESGDRIVMIQNWDAEAGAPEPRSLHDYETWRREVQSIETLEAAYVTEYRLRTDTDRFESARVVQITPSAFVMLDVEPLLGRNLTAADTEPGAPPVAVIGYDMWQRLFDGDASVIGRDLRVGSAQSTIVGVMPEGFGFPVNHEVWVPFRERALDHARGEGPPIRIFGRLAPGHTRETAQAELTALGQRAAADFPVTNAELRPRVGPFLDLGFEAVVVRVANVVFLLLLFVVCANIATLVFARTVTREDEIALRTALGASRGRIILQLFTEALLLTTIASIIGLSVASFALKWGLDLLWEVQQMRAPFWVDAGLSVSTAAYVFALAVLGAAVIGVIPALKATGSRLRSRLASPGTGGSSLRFGAVSTIVIVVQVALCVALLPLAILQSRDLLPDRQAAERFPAHAVLSGQLLLQMEAAPDALPPAEREAVFVRTAALQAEVRQRLAALPGVDAITFADRLPGMNHPAQRVRIEGDLVVSDSLVRIVRTLAVDPDFFQAMGSRVVSGRAFRSSDLGSAVDVVILGRSFADRLLNGQNVVGHRLRYTGRPDSEAERWYEIVGVVEDPAMVTFGAGEYVGVYRPLVPGRQAAVHLFVRASSPVPPLLPRIHDVVGSVHADLAVDELMTMEEVWRPTRKSNRFFIGAMALVSAIALLLSLAGIYALMSFTVAQRVREISIRAALGAHPRRILVAIFSRALLQIGLGVLAGGLLISLTVIDDAEGAGIVAAVAALMFTVGLMACALPALRALRIAPADVLRGG